MSALLLVLALVAQHDLEALVERFYLGAKVALAENASCLEADQRAWQRALKACQDAACVKRARVERLATLQALQASVPGGLDLPAQVPQLLWAIAPEGDARAGGKPLQVKGRLEYGDGYSLRMEGLEPGINDAALERAIVMHGAPYVDPQAAAKQGRLGRSFGCPAVREAVARGVIDVLKDGQFVFAYYPDAKWLDTARWKCAG